MTQSVNYSARRGTVSGMEMVRLSDSAPARNLDHQAMGNMAYEMSAGGRNILWFPYQSPAELKRAPTLCGAPFAMGQPHRRGGLLGQRQALHAEPGLGQSATRP